MNQKTFLKFSYTVIGLFTVAYITLCTYFYIVQHSILFKPSTLPQDFEYAYTFDYEERWFDVADDERVHAIHAKTQDSTRGLVFFLHGNAGNTNTRESRMQLFLEMGYDLIYPDYRGYGKSTGELENEEDLVGDMKSVYQEMLKEYPDSVIQIIGYSMGSGVAAQVAAANNPDGLILWTPYYSMIDMKNMSYPFLPDFLIKFPLRTDLALPKVEEPITIFYAEDDEVLPIERSLKLNDLLKPTDETVILENQGHNWVDENAQLREKLEQILTNKD